MTEDELRQQAPIQGAAFRQLRRKGAELADQSVIEVDGLKYRMYVDRPCSIETHHVTLQCLDAPHHQVAMVALLWKRRVPYGSGIDDTGLMMRAWTEGLAVNPADSPHFHTWRVLPFVWPPKLKRNRRKSG